MRMLKDSSIFKYRVRLPQSVLTNTCTQRLLIMRRFLPLPPDWRLDHLIELAPGKVEAEFEVVQDDEVTLSFVTLANDGSRSKPTVHTFTASDIIPPESVGELIVDVIGKREYPKLGVRK